MLKNEVFLDIVLGSILAGFGEVFGRLWRPRWIKNWENRVRKGVPHKIMICYRFGEGFGRVLGGFGEGFGRVLAGSGSLLGILGGSQGHFLLFLLVLIAFCSFLMLLGVWEEFGEGLCWVLPGWA